jgi:hypothetical protein
MSFAFEPVQRGGEESSPPHPPSHVSSSGRENVKQGLTDLCLLVEDLKLDIVDAPDEVRALDP